MGAPISDGFHHRSTTKQSHKPFKTKHATKSEIKERSKGKVERLEPGSRRTPHQQTMSKLDRRNQAKQKRINNTARREEEASVFAGRDGAPRLVAVIPLCADIDTETVASQLNLSVDQESLSTQEGIRRCEITRFKQTVQYLLPARDLFETLNACRLADFVILVLSAEVEVDQLGEHMLKCIESQGVSTVITAAQHLDKVESVKRRTDVLKSLKGFITHFFATQEKIHDISNRQDCSNVMRSLCTTTPKGIRWKDDRSWMHVENVRWEQSNCVLTGVIRGRNLKSDRLVHVGDWGDFRIGKVTAAPRQTKQRHHKTDSIMQDTADHILDQPTEDQDDLNELAPEDTAMEEGVAVSIAPSERRHVLLDDHQYHDEDLEDEAETVLRRVPKGTSKYQAAWYLGDVSDSGSDLEDYEGDDTEMSDEDGNLLGPADGHFENGPEPTEAGAPSEYPQSEFFEDRAPEDEAEQLEAYRMQKKEEAEDDLEFPDEIELHPHASAKERLARYRGLKSLRTSTWDTEEDRLFQPDVWDRLLDIADPKAARNRVLKDALLGGAKAGQRVDVHLQVSAEQQASLAILPQPLSLFSLLKHEHKQTVINVSITLSSDYPAPLKSKTELIMQCGPRRLRINPLFSQPGNTPNNVHKFERYLHPGRTAVASFIGPVTWGSIPCLFFLAANPEPADVVEELAKSMQSESSTQLEPIATGTLLPPSTSRVIAKRVILAGHPYKIHKRLVTIRYMFFNNEDVEYFKSLPLWTRRGRSGFIKETLGTHGYFKATFDGKINPMDSVGISLYKRVWPRQSYLWSPSYVQMDQQSNNHQSEDIQMG